MIQSLVAQVPEYIRSLVPYVPGKPIEETQREYGLKKVTKLASNENPLGPSSKVIGSLKRALKDINRYPDGSAYKLKQALSKHLDVSASSLFVGNGSNEVIELLIRTYCVAGDAMVTSEAAFLAYKICAQVHGLRCLEARLTDDFRFDLEAMLKLVKDDDRVRMVFIANPNNPTGTYVSDSELMAFLREVALVRSGSVLVVLDYAYWEYVRASDLSDPLSLVREFSNVIVLRTFSKIYGLAGLRVGYGIGRPDVLSAVEKVREPFNVNALALVAAEAALSDQAFVSRSQEVNIEGMKFWEQELKAIGIPFWKSEGNFLLVNVRQGLGRSGGEVYQACLKRGVIFRPVTNYKLPDALRISIGRMVENRVAARALWAIREEMPL